MHKVGVNGEGVSYLHISKFCKSSWLSCIDDWEREMRDNIREREGERERGRGGGGSQTYRQTDKKVL